MGVLSFFAGPYTVLHSRTIGQRLFPGQRYSRRLMHGKAILMQNRFSNTRGLRSGRVESEKLTRTRFLRKTELAEGVSAESLVHTANGGGKVMPPLVLFLFGKKI